MAAWAGNADILRASSVKTAIKNTGIKCVSKLLYTGRHFWNRKCRKKTWWQQEFAVFKCEATANSVTGHVCVNSNIDKNYNPKQNTGKNKEIIRYIQKNIMKTCIF